MVKVVLVDDEPKALKSLLWLLNKYCKKVKVKGAFNSPKKAIEFLKEFKVDCVFLDIEMPEIDGFAFLKFFDKRDFKVVFITAHNEYAIQAIRASAMDYLLKPVEPADLINVITKLKINKIQEEERRSEIERSNLFEKIAISTEGRLIYLNWDDILYCESDGNYCKIFLEDGKSLTVSKKIKYIQSLLSDSVFYRVHNSYLINIQKVKEYLRKEGQVVLTNQAKIPVSRNRRAEFLKRMIG